MCFVSKKLPVNCQLYFKVNLIFFQIKPLKSLQLAKEGALEFTRKELDMKRGGNTSLANWKYAKKSYTCIQCRDNFENQAEADRHFNCPEHKEVFLFKLIIL